MKKNTLLTLLLLGVSLTGLGWGFYGHKIITQLAIYALPRQMQPFYYRHQQLLVETSVRPDQRRNEDPAEAPRHFIDVDVYGDSAFQVLPQAWQKAVKVFPADTLRKYGVVPWQVLQLKDRLTAAFRYQDADSILFYSADLGHYISDAHVPLHTTLNYDGQLTGQRGLHSLWESKIPELFLNEFQLTHGPATYLPDPEAAIWSAVRTTFQLVQPTVDLERKATTTLPAEEKYVQVERDGRTRQYYSDAFAKAYHAQLEDMVEKQMQASAQMVASFWYTCWVDGGKPNLTRLLEQPPTRAERQALKRELKAWRKGSLAKQDLVLAKPRQATAE